MLDRLSFKIINPNGKEEWAQECNISKVVEIYLNGIEIVTILKEIETPYAQEENHEDLAGAYGHVSPDELYVNLTKYEEDVEILCCCGCGDSGCWSIIVDIEKDEKFVYWKRFRNNHRDWKYDISYKFDKDEYEKSILLLIQSKS